MKGGSGSRETWREKYSEEKHQEKSVMHGILVDAEALCSLKIILSRIRNGKSSPRRTLRNTGEKPKPELL